MFDEYRDLARRAFWTFVQVFLSVGLVGPALSLDIGVWQLAALSGVGAALSVLKSFAARQLARMPSEDVLE